MKPQKASQRLLKPKAPEAQKQKTHRSHWEAPFLMAMAVAAVEICHDQVHLFPGLGGLALWFPGSPAGYDKHGTSFIQAWHSLHETPVYVAM